MAAFGGVVVTRAYASFTAWSYPLFTGFLALPLLLQPVIWPSAGVELPERQQAAPQALSFIGN
jgi:hypothetical protein